MCVILICDACGWAADPRDPKVRAFHEEEVRRDFDLWSAPCSSRVCPYPKQGD